MEDAMEVSRIKGYTEGLETLAGELICVLDDDLLNTMWGRGMGESAENIRWVRDTLLAYMQQESEKQDTYRCPICCAPECSH